MYSTPANTVTVSVDNNSDKAGSMFITVYGPSKEYVDDVMALVTSEIENVQKTLNTSVAKHGISFVNNQSMVKSESLIRDGQANQTAKLETLRSLMTAVSIGLRSTPSLLMLRANQARRVKKLSLRSAILL